MRISVLGPLEVWVAGSSVSLGGPQQRLLLALLVADRDHPVSTDRLIEGIWGDEPAPDSARKAVQVYVARLRKSLGDDSPIESVRGGYELTTAGLELDSLVFEAAVRESLTQLAAEPGAVVRSLTEALALWHGRAYADLEDAEPLRGEINRLEELRLVAVERRLEASLALGHHREELGALEALASEHPYRERFIALQMLALYRSGRQAEALRSYQRARTLLGQELGIEPSPELQNLEYAILTHDPSLEPAPAAALAVSDQPSGANSVRGYELRERLAEADDTTLWRAYLPATGREVTLMIVGPNTANDSRFVHDFEPETRRFAQLDHPHLASIHDFWRDPGGAYVVMPSLRGGTLSEARRRGPWRLSTALRLIDQVGSAAGGLHRNGMAHGSLGPDWVLLDNENNAYLAVAVGLGRRNDTGRGSTSDLVALAALLRLIVDPDEVTAALGEVLDRAGEMERVEDLLRAIRQVTGSDAVDPQAAELAPTRPVRNPYKGLRAFQETDAADFFGRDALIARLVDTVAERPLTAVVGASGSGKSSVLKAGLVPAVAGGALDGSWVAAQMFPGSFPFEELESALSRVAVVRPDGLMSDLMADDRGLLRVVKRVLPHDDTGLLLVIDQFEELYSLTSDPEVRRLFLDSLVTLSADERSRVRVVLTLRGDFFDRPLEHPAFAELLRQGLVTVAMPDRDSLAQMVSQPARRAGLELEPGLATEVVTDVMNQPGGLPLLQYALTELVERSDGRLLTVAGYRETGGVLGALGQRAEEIYRGLPPSSQQVAERIFLRLVTVDDEKEDTRRRVRRTELVSLGLDRATVDLVLGEFAAFRLLSFDHDPATRGPTVEVAHEALIREWPRFRGWVDDRREQLLVERRLREAAAEWENSGRDAGFLLRGRRLAQFETSAGQTIGELTAVERRLIEESRTVADAERADEQRRVQRLRRLVGAFAVALVVALVAGLVAVQQRNDAQDATAGAELATLISRSAALVRDDPDVATLLALEAYRREPSRDTELALLNVLASPSFGNQVATLPPPPAPAGVCRAEAVLSSDGLIQTQLLDGRLWWRDLLDGEWVDEGRAPTECGTWIFDPSTGKAAVQGDDGSDLWFAPQPGEWVEFESSDRTFLTFSSFRENQRTIIAVVDEDGFPNIYLVDDEAASLVAGPFTAGPESYFLQGTQDATGDGRLFALGFAIDDDPEGDGRTLLIDGESGDVLHTVVTSVPVDEVFIDDAAGQLVMSLFDGDVVTADLESGEIVAQVSTGRSSELRDMGVRNDGLVITVSLGQIELVDRLTGPTGDVVELRDVLGARITDDGDVVVRKTDESLDVLDLSVTGFIERTWEIEPFTQPAFESGRAAAVVDGGAVVTDLATGEVTRYGLPDPEGGRFSAVKAYPEPDGVWAFSITNVLARWEGDEQVERLDLGGRHFTRTQLGDRIAVLSEQDGGELTTQLVDVERGAATVLLTVATPDAFEVHPGPDDGLLVIELDGTLVIYDSSGSVVGEIETEVDQAGIITADLEAGLVAVARPEAAVAVVDIAAATVERIPGARVVSNLGFGRDGELLAVTSRDGTVRLWDVERGEFVGLVWEGSGGGVGSPSWYDEESGAMWVTSSGKYLEIPLDPERWVERACQLVGRDLTPAEWARFVPGDEPVRSACT